MLGGIPTGLWLGRRAGIDVRASGSGNIGATNVARTAGLGLGVITLAVDAGKGALPVVAARALDLYPGTAAAAALATILGHIFPVFGGFRGGKGVATAAGAFLALSPLVWLGAMLVFAAVAYFSQIVSFASLAAAAALATGALLAGSPEPIRMAAVCVFIVLVTTHRENVGRLLRGTEPRFRPRTGPQASG